MNSLRTLSCTTAANLLLCSLSFIPALAQQNGQRSEDQALAAQEKQLCKSWAGHDSSQMEPMVAPEFVFVDEDGGAPREQLFEQMKRDALSSCTAIDSDVKVYGNAAWTFSVALFEAPNFAEQRALADMWVRSGDGAWRLVFRHSTRQDPTEYLNHALELMATNSFRRSDVDWKQVRSSALARAEGAQIPADTYDAIRFALYSLGDHHSHLQLTPELEALEARRRAQRKASLRLAAEEFAFPQTTPSPLAARTAVEGKLLPSNGKMYALVVVPAFSPQSDDQGVAFESALQKLIAQLDDGHPAGWIVDLRGNLGGNVWPMLAGLGPLLGDQDNLGQSMTLDGQSTNYYRNGTAGFIGPQGNTYSYPPMNGSTYKLTSPALVAVLVDHSTASSGEITALAFKGSAKARFFGEHTLGATTVTNGWTLIDGANPVIAVGVSADRQGRRYPNGIDPDEVISAGDRALAPEQDPVVMAAMKWLGKEN
jgi:hypothetical protein